MTTIAQLIASASPHGGSARRPGHGKTRTQLTPQLVNLLESQNDLDPGGFEALREQLNALRASDAFQMETTPAGIDHALTQLVQFDGHSRTPLDGASSALRGALNQELLAHKRLVSDFQSDARRELSIAAALAAGMLVITILLWSKVRQRVLTPLNNLIGQMSLLARRDYSELPVTGTDPMLYPMINNYNSLVQRLKTLERAQQQRQETLTREVRNATHMLLQQQRLLAQAERLGAIGEVAAGVAHELRNPLTGVRMALDNLRLDLEGAELIERVDLINDEVKRVTRQLNQLLDQARQRPETPTRLEIGDEFDRLATLAAYQLNENISIRYDLEQPFGCLLPRSQFRQVLLNLILNAAQAIGNEVGDILLQLPQFRL
jgi:C4-dicarboxylate-specific signal transduction histidine kinase